MSGAGVSVSGFLTLVPFLLIVTSYAFILRTVLPIPSATGGRKPSVPIPPTSVWSRCFMASSLWSM